VHDPVPERAAPAWLTADGTTDVVLGLLKTGKEAEVFLVERTLGEDRRAVLAHKRYRPVTVRHKGELEELGFTKARSFANDARYREGRGRQRSGRDARAIAARSAHGRRLLAGAWLDDEVANLVRAFDAGATVPYVVERTDDGLLMQLVGDEQGAAPRLVNARLDHDELHAAFAQLVADLRALTAAGLVHADLSPFNALWWDERLWLIDFPQAVDLYANPNGFELLHHDVATMCAWFARRGIDCDADELYGSLL
jgi:RIO kinase 1